MTTPVLTMPAPDDDPRGLDLAAVPVIAPVAAVVSSAEDKLRRLRRLQWGVRAALVLGVAASIAANMLHAQPSIVGRAISAWSPVALLITVELISRVPVHRRALAYVGRVAMAAVALIAAYVSYFHMVSVALRYGETPVSAHLLPLSVDGLVVVASIALLEVGGQIRAALTTAPAAVAPVPPADAPPAPAPSVVPVPVRPATSAGTGATRPRGTAASRARGTGATRRPARSGRHTLAELLGPIPPDDPRSDRQLAAELGPAAGLTPATARRYLAEIRNKPAAAAAMGGV